jgi:hypothetical protein
MRQAPDHRLLHARKGGFTLIELITAMLSATIVVVTLSSAIVISTSLLESPPDDQAKWDQREIVDRVANDMRYASSITEGSGYGFQISRPNPATGADETVNYELYIEGMKRTVNGGPTMQLNTETPSHQFYVDGYSAPTATSSDDVRVRGTTSAATDSAASSLDIAVPPGAKSGDFMLLCIAAKTPNQVGVSTSGWEAMQVVGIDDIRLLVFKHRYSSSWDPTATITVTPNAGIAATMLAIENTDTYYGVDWSATRGNYAWSFIPSTHPTPYESSGFADHQLNVQVFASDNDPWNNGTFGMASFTGVGQATSSPSNSTYRTTARLLQLSSGYWLQVGIRLGVSP